MLEQQNIKPTKLFTDGKTGTIYTYTNKTHLQKLIKKIKTELIEKEIDGIFTSDTLKRISEIKTSTPQIVKEVHRKQKKVAICCVNCGHITFLTQEQHAIIKARGTFICPNPKCRAKLKIKG